MSTEIFFNTIGLRETHGLSANLFQEIGKKLPNHIGYFFPVQDNFDYTGFLDFELQFDNAIFVNRDVKVLEAGFKFICEKRNGMKDFETLKWKHMPRNICYVNLKLGTKKYQFLTIMAIGKRAERVIHLKEFLNPKK